MTGPRTYRYGGSAAMQGAVRLIMEALKPLGTKALADITLTVGGGTPSRSNSEFFNGTTPWITVADLELRHFAPQSILTAREFITEEALQLSAARLIPVGSVVLATRVSVGKVGIAKVPLATNQDFTSFLPQKSLDSRFLAYFLISSTGSMLEAVRGTTIKGIKREDLLRLQIPILALPIQETVAAYLDEVAEYGAAYAAENSGLLLPNLARSIPRIVARIEELAAKIAEARGLRREALVQNSHLLGNVEKPLYADMTRKFGNTNIGSIASLQGGYAFRSNELQEEGIPILKIANISDGRIKWDERTCIAYDQKDEFSNYCLEEGDIVIAMTRPVIKGAIKAGIITKYDLPCLLNQRVGRFKDISQHIDKKYFYRFILSSVYREEVEKRSQGGQQPNIGNRDIEAIELPLPPLSEQHRIVAYFESLQAKVDALKALQAETQAELDALLPAVLDKAFRGEL